MVVEGDNSVEVVVSMGDGAASAVMIIVVVTTVVGEWRW